MNQLITTSLLVVFISSSVVQGQPVAKRTCEPIARVLSVGDRIHQLGSLLCQGDRIEAETGTVEILCYSDPKVVVFEQGSTSDVKCIPPQAEQREECELDNRRRCLKLPNYKGGGGEQPALITPYGYSILDRRPLLSWASVPGATYSVQVSGKGVNWSRELTGTSLPYPEQEPSLEWGNVYRVDVIANQASVPVNVRSTVLIVIPVTKAEKITNVVERIQRLNLALDEKAYDLATAYLSENLLTEAINVLDGRRKAGTKNGRIYKLLGKCYLEAGLKEAAQKAYFLANSMN